MLTPDQEARLLVCEERHGPAVVGALTDDPRPDDRMVSLSRLERAIRASDEPVGVLLAWLGLLLSESTIRPLQADLEVPWPKHPDVDDAALVATLAANPRCWYYEIRAALILAERVLDSSAATPALVEALLSLRTRLEEDRLHSSEYFRGKLLPWLLQLVARTSPAGIPDLSFIERRDGWGRAVMAMVDGRPDAAHIASALAHLGSPRGGRASRAWWSRTSDLVATEPALVDVVLQALDLVTRVDLTPHDPEQDGWDVPDEYLLTPANEQLARGLAWSTRLLRPNPSLADLLGRVTLRSAVMTWVIPAHRMVCPKLAYAAVDSLIAIDSADSRAQLATLVEELRVPILIRRIGEHLGTPDTWIRKTISDLKARGPLPRPDRNT